MINIVMILDTMDLAEKTMLIFYKVFTYTVIGILLIGIVRQIVKKVKENKKNQ